MEALPESDSGFEPLDFLDPPQIDFELAEWNKMMEIAERAGITGDFSVEDLRLDWTGAGDVEQRQHGEDPTAFSFLTEHLFSADKQPGTLGHASRLYTGSACRLPSQPGLDSAAPICAPTTPYPLRGELAAKLRKFSASDSDGSRVTTPQQPCWLHDSFAHQPFPHPPGGNSHTQATPPHLRDVHDPPPQPMTSHSAPWVPRRASGPLRTLGILRRETRRRNKDSGNRPDPAEFYGDPPPRPEAWGPLRKFRTVDAAGGGVVEVEKRRFEYTSTGQLVADPPFSADEMAWYMYGGPPGGSSSTCTTKSEGSEGGKGEKMPFAPRQPLPGEVLTPGKVRSGLVLWIGSVPAQVRDRFPILPGGVGAREGQRGYPRCLFAECTFLRPREALRSGSTCTKPRSAASATSHPGSEWVVFDERRNETGELFDPYLVNAGYAHLRCVEAHFDLAALWDELDVRLDERELVREDANYVHVSRIGRDVPGVVARWMGEVWPRYLARVQHQHQHLGHNFGASATPEPLSTSRPGGEHVRCRELPDTWLSTRLQRHRNECKRTSVRNQEAKRRRAQEARDEWRAHARASPYSEDDTPHAPSPQTPRQEPTWWQAPPVQLPGVLQGIGGVETTLFAPIPQRPVQDTSILRKRSREIDQEFLDCMWTADDMQTRRTDAASPARKRRRFNSSGTLLRGGENAPPAVPPTLRAPAERMCSHRGMPASTQCSACTCTVVPLFLTPPATPERRGQMQAREYCAKAAANAAAAINTRTATDAAATCNVVKAAVDASSGPDGFDHWLDLVDWDAQEDFGLATVDS